MRVVRCYAGGSNVVEVSWEMHTVHIIRELFQCNGRQQEQCEEITFPLPVSPSRCRRGLKIQQLLEGIPTMNGFLLQRRTGRARPKKQSKVWELGKIALSIDASMSCASGNFLSPLRAQFVSNPLRPRCRVHRPQGPWVQRARKRNGGWSSALANQHPVFLECEDARRAMDEP